MPASLRSEKIHSSGKEYSADVPSIHGDEDAPIRPIDPKILRRATLKIDFYLIPIIGMFCELYFLSHLTYYSSLPFQDLLSFLVSIPAIPYP